MGELPTGTVTFLFTDIEGSTRLLQHLGDDIYDRLLGEHHRILRDAIAAHDGVEISTEGDAFFVVFARAADAVAMTLDAQTALGCHEWPESGAVRVRMGLHTGLGRLGGDSYVGLAVHQAARISSSAHGGQVVSSQATRDAAGVLAGVAWQGLGHHRLKDLGGPVELFQLCHPDLIPEFPPLRSLRARQPQPARPAVLVPRSGRGACTWGETAGLHEAAQHHRPGRDGKDEARLSNRGRRAAAVPRRGVGDRAGLRVEPRPRPRRAPRGSRASR